MPGDPRVLVTGFEAYGGWRSNPTAEVAQALDGAVIGGAQVVGRVLPVVLRGLEARVLDLLAELEPALVVSLGLNPSATTLRIERTAVNVADFSVPDNAAEKALDVPLCSDGPVGYSATLPIREIQRAHLRQGIPSLVSNSAGTYLCNAIFYHFLAATHGSACRAGFIHVPFSPPQAAALLSAEGDADAASGGSGMAEPASMDTQLMVEGVRTAIHVALGR